jgi:hypothetical protein
MFSKQKTILSCNNISLSSFFLVSLNSARNMRSQPFTSLTNDENFVQIVPEDIKQGTLLRVESRKGHCEYDGVVFLVLGVRSKSLEDPETSKVLNSKLVQVRFQWFRAEPNRAAMPIYPHKPLFSYFMEILI